MSYEQQERVVYDIDSLDPYAVNAYVAKVFGWMFLGLLVTAITTMAIIYGINVSQAFAEFIFGLQQAIFIVVIAEVALVFYLSARITKLQPATAKALYIIYAISNGFTFGLVAVIIAYGAGMGMQTLGVAFLVTALSFGIMAVYGLFTKADLTKFGKLFMMGIIGLVIASIANIFIGGSMLDLAIIIFGLVLFLGLTAYHTYNIKHHYARVALGDGEIFDSSLSRQQLGDNLAIIGALQLYLAFINMFFFILRLLTRR